MGIFFLATDGTMCPGVESASKNDYQDTPGGKDDRCVRVTTLPPSMCRKSRKSGALTYRKPLGPLGLSRGPLFTQTNFILWPVRYQVVRFKLGQNTAEDNEDVLISN